MDCDLKQSYQKFCFNLSLQSKNTNIYIYMLILSDKINVFKNKLLQWKIKIIEMFLYLSEFINDNKMNTKQIIKKKWS